MPYTLTPTTFSAAVVAGGPILLASLAIVVGG